MDSLALNRDIEKWQDIPIRETLYWIPKLSFGTVFDYLKVTLGGDIVINGSYRTGNIGDKAIGLTIKNKIENEFDRKCILNGCNFIYQNFSKFNIYILGGGALNDNKNLIYRLSPLKYAKKSMIMGNSINLMNSIKNKKALKLIRHANFITVRDNISKEYLEKFIDNEISVTADPAFIYKKGNNKPIDGSLGISLKYLRNYDETIKKKFIKFLNNNIKTLAKDYDLHFIAFAPEDIIFIRKYFSQYSDILHFARTPDKTIKIIGKMEKMICMRLHSLIFSIIEEKPLFVINYAEKMDELSEKCKSFINLKNINENDSIYFNNNTNHISSIRREYQKKSKENFNIFSNLL